MPELLFIAFALMAGLSLLTLALKALLGLALLIDRLGTAAAARRRPIAPPDAWARA